MLLATKKLKAAMLKQRLVASWRLLGKHPFGHPNRLRAGERIPRKRKFSVTYARDTVL